MERLSLWWKNLTVRDRRALTLLGIVLPVILLWWAVTAPLKERLLLAKRVLDIKRKQAIDLQNGLFEYTTLKQKIINNETQAEVAVVAKVEQLLREAKVDDDKFLLMPVKTKIGDKFFDTVLLTFNNLHPQSAWKLLQLLYAHKSRISEYEISASPKSNTFSGKLKLWLAKK